jgi:hypothetical protein
LAARLLAYLEAVRDGVCRRCGGRPAGDPCGTVLSLEQLIAALEQARSVPERASAAGRCPCSMQRLAAEAAEEIERKR